MGRSLWLGVLCLTVSATGFAAGDSALDRATLRGVGAMGIIVDRLDPDLAAQGITPDVIESRVRARLESAGLKVDRAASEFVGIRILQVRGARGPFAMSVGVGLYQPVLLARDKERRTATQTWEVETVLLAEPKLLYRAAMETLDELADHFVSAYQSANPK